VPAITTLHPLRCRGCGASVPVKHGMRFVDCEYCRSRMEVVIPESQTAELSAKVEDLRLREELRNLDASWQRYVQKVSVKVPSGDLQEPGDTVVVETAMLGIGGTAIAAIALAQVSVLLLIVAIPAGILITWHIVSGTVMRKRSFESAKLLHENTRRELLRRIEKNRSALAR